MINPMTYPPLQSVINSTGIKFTQQDDNCWFVLDVGDNKELVLWVQFDVTLYGIRNKDAYKFSNSTLKLTENPVVMLVKLIEYGHKYGLASDIETQNCIIDAYMNLKAEKLRDSED